MVHSLEQGQLNSEHMGAMATAQSIRTGEEVGGSGDSTFLKVQVQIQVQVQQPDPPLVYCVRSCNA